MPVRTILPYSKTISLGIRKGMPLVLKTAGDHVRKARIERRLSQPEVARQIGVTTDCVTFWENNRSRPQVQHYPRIVRFLGYYPFRDEMATLGDTLLMHRRLAGLPLAAFAKRIGVDAQTVSRWERNLSAPSEFMLRVFYDLNIEDASPS